MEIKPLKTVRFTQLIESSGHPEPVTLWTPPEDDPAFSQAIKEQRVLTVIQRTVGAKADYGLVGFFKEPLATYLVFPKKLEYPSETKVIGIKYGQLAESKPKGPLHKAKEKPLLPRIQKQVRGHKHAPEPAPDKSAPAQAEPEPPPKPIAPKVHRYVSNIQIESRQIVPVEVEASSPTEAARLVREKMAALQPTLENAKITRRASKPRKVTENAAH